MKFKALVVIVAVMITVLAVGFGAQAQQKPNTPPKPPPKASPQEKGKKDSKIKEEPSKPAEQAKPKEEKKEEAKPAETPKPVKKLIRRIRRYRPHYTEHEPNNTNETANVTSVLKISGRLSSTDTEDWFKLNGQESDMARFVMTTPKSAIFGLDIFSGTSLVASFQGACLAKAIPVKIPDYCWIRVYRLSGTGAYKVSITPTPTYSRKTCRSL